jgi:hypothetical protein
VCLDRLEVQDGNEEPDRGVMVAHTQGDKLKMPHRRIKITRMISSFGQIDTPLCR